KDLMIETSPGPKLPVGLDPAADKAGVDRIIDQWADDKFRNEQIDGVLVLLVENDAVKKIRVRVGPNTAKSGMFTKAHVDELVGRIQKHLKTNDRDGALHAITSYVAETMQRHSQPAGLPPPPVGRGAPPQAQPPAVPQREVEANPVVVWLLIGLGILIAVWIISAVIRGLRTMSGGYGPGYGAGYGPGYSGGPAPSGGGGFLTGFLGGLFGAAAGMWAYNHFFGGGTPSAFGSDHGRGQDGGFSGGAVAGPSDVGAGDPIGGGGDWGKHADAAGGGEDWGAGHGDWGGGGMGGGDWGGGGGDWGGGGGDIGGGGGDW
ncbi:MAG: hypothetical protein NZO58_07385, partial [Gemmataceae bacterium]|nr:hypothetical protein [Gemmataceae bacterium]